MNVTPLSVILALFLAKQLPIPFTCITILSGHAARMSGDSKQSSRPACRFLILRHRLLKGLPEGVARSCGRQIVFSTQTTVIAPRPVTKEDVCQLGCHPSMPERLCPP